MTDRPQIDEDRELEALVRRAGLERVLAGYAADVQVARRTAESARAELRALGPTIVEPWPPMRVKRGMR